MELPATRFYRTIPDHPAVNSLPALAKVLLATLYYHLNKDTGQLNPRQSTLARELRCSIWTVQRHVRELRESGIIRTIKGHRSSRYQILPVERWGKSNCSEKARLGKSDAAEMPGQTQLILYERETLFLKESAAVNSRGLSQPESQTGGGGMAHKALPERLSSPAVRQAPTPPPSPLKERSNPPDPDRDCELRVSPPQLREKAVELVQELLPNHPTVGNPAKAIEVIGKLLEVEPGAEVLLRKSHTQFRKLWANYKPGRFIPQLWRWVQENDWRYPPTESQVKAAVGPGTLHSPAEDKAAAKRRREGSCRVGPDSKPLTWDEEMKLLRGAGA